MVFPSRCIRFSSKTEDNEENESHSTLTKKRNSMRAFTVDELKTATNNFSGSQKIAVGGFGRVFKGVVKSLEHPFDDIQVAVKRANGGLQEYQEWLREVNLLGVAEHSNVVKLLGYCVEENEWYLVYEYMPNGSLEDHLSTNSKTPLSLYMRLKVAQDVARALTYLHEDMEFQINFRDFKSSNIFLDGQWKAKISDYAMARLGPQVGLTHVSNTVYMGYVAPEFMRTGHLTSKSDVWSYGVFLYELITGRRAWDSCRPKDKQKLLEWVKPYLRSTWFHLIIDPRLEGDYSLKSAQKLSIIANKCLSKTPKSRPKMSEVLEMVNRLIEVQSQATNDEPSHKSLFQEIEKKLMKFFMCTTKL